MSSKSTNQKTVLSPRFKQTGIQLHIPSDTFYIEPVRAFVVNLAENFGFSLRRVADIQLVLDEICSNAVHHGSADPSVGVELYINLNANALEILVRDTGPKNTPEGGWLTPERLAEIEMNRSPSNERGHGIFIVKSLSDTHEMRLNETGGTDVRVVFQLSKPRNAAC